jgi:hypothetical protein
MPVRRVGILCVGILPADQITANRGGEYVFQVREMNVIRLTRFEEIADR